MKNSLSRKKAFSTDRLLFLIVFAVFVTVAAVFFVLQRKPSVEAAWFNDQWGYRQRVDVTNAGTAQTDYQVSVTLNTSALITAGKMQSDCDDIRVTDVNGKVLPIWIETGTNACNTTTTAIWTKVPSISTTGTTVFLYYGNPSAANTQNGNNVFTFFDDFSGSSVDTTKWTAHAGAPVVSSGLINFRGGVANDGITSVAMTLLGTGNYSMEARHRINSGSNTWNFGFNGAFSGTEPTTNSFQLCTTCSNASWIFRNGYSAYYTTTKDTEGLWRITKMSYIQATSGTATLYSDGRASTLLTYTATTSLPTMSLFDRIHFISHTKDADMDWVFIHKNAATLPSVASPTNEEKSLAPIAYWKFDEGNGVTASNSFWKKTGTVTNLINNPSMETGMTGQTYCQNNSCSQSSDKTTFGGYSAKAISTAAGWILIGQNAGEYINVSPSTTYSTSFWAYSATGGRPAYMYLIEFQSNGTYITERTVVGPITIPANTWTRVVGNFTSGGTTGKVSMRMTWDASAGSQIVYFDGDQLEAGSVVNNYCDGSLIGNGSHSWNGTAHASPSTCDTGTDSDLRSTSWASEDQCISGKCQYFNGTTSYVLVPHGDGSLMFKSGDFSVSIWAKPTSMTSYSGLITTDIAGDAAWKIYRDTGNSFFSARYGTGTLNYPAVNTNEWHQYGYVKSGTTLTLYLDGKQVNQGSVPATHSVNGTELVLGSYRVNDAKSGTWIYKGYLDEPKIYNYARSAAQIKADFASKGSGTSKGTSVSLSSSRTRGSSLSEGLVGYWKMDEASWNGTAGEVIDSSGNGNNGTSNCGGTCSKPTTGSGKFGNGGIFDGVDDYVGISYTNPTTATSVVAWFKRSGTPAGGYHIITGGADVEISINEAGGYIRTGVTTATQGRQVFNSGSGLVDGNWHQVALTYDGSSLKSFIDGAQTASNPVSGSLSGTATEIGRFLSNSYVANGKIDEVRIYNRALSPKEVRDLYAFAPGPVGYWSFEEGSGNPNDSSGNGNNGTWNGTGTQWTNGKFGKAGNFNGSDGFITINHTSSLDVPNAWTSSAWVYLNATPVGYPSVFTDFYPGTEQKVQFDLSFTNGTAVPEMGFFNATSWYRASAPSAIPLYTWTYLSGTYDGPSGTLKMYVNGILVGTTTSVPTSIGSVTTAKRIGRRWDNPDYINGKIDEVKLYNYARTQKQIVEDMNAGHPVGGSPVGSQVGYWKFDEGYGTTNAVHDSSSQNNTGTWSGSGTHWTNQGKFGKAGSFNGTSDYVDVGNGASLNTQSEVTVTAWVKANDVGANFEAIYARGDPTFRFGISGTAWGARPWIFINGVNYLVDNGFAPYWGQWTYVAFVFSDPQNLAQIYINGKRILNDTNATATIPTLTVNGFIGQRGDGGYLFNGLIDEVKVYSSALTEDEIKLDYNRGSAMVLGDSVENRDRVTSGQTLYLDATDKTSYPGTGTAWYDRSGNGYNASLSSPTWNGLKFTNTAATLTGLGTSIYPNIATNTTILWVYPETGGGGVWSVTDQDGHTYMSYSGDGNAYINTWETGTYNQRTVWNVTESVPHQIVITKNGSVRTVYDNLVQKGQVTITNIATSVNSNIVYGSAGSPMGLSIVETYNRVLSTDEITQDYNAHAYKFNLDAGPVAEWKMDEKTGTTAYDTSGNNRNLSFGNTPTWINGKVGAALDFDRGDYAYVDWTDFTLSNHTIEFWVKADSLSGGWEDLVGTYLGTDINRFHFYSGTSAISFYSVHGTCGTVNSGVVPVVGQWYHVAGVADGTNAIIYINGQRKSSIACTGSHISPGVYLAGPSGETFDGQIDQVKIYDYARTPAQIAYDYNRGAPVGHWKMDECQGGTANDSSGNGNTGTITIGGTGTQTAVGTCTTSGTAWYNGATGKYNSSLNFDGTDDYVVISSPSRGSLNPEYLTVGAWVKPSAAQFGQIVSKNGPYALYMNTDRTITFNIYAGSTPAWSGITTTDTIPLSSWSHVSGTYDGTTMKIYINGTLSKTGAHSQGGVAYATGANVYIGYGNPGFNQYFSGQIDDVRVYNYALTPLQIKTLYNGGSTIRFGPSTGSP